MTSYIASHRRFFLVQTNDVLAVLNFSRLASNSVVICSHFEYVLENYSSNVVEVGNTLMQKVCKARIKMHATDELFAARCKTEDLQSRRGLID